MTDYLRYALNPVLLAVTGYGLWAGDRYVWLGFAVLLGILLIDCFQRPDFGIRDQRFPWLYDTIVSIQILVAFCLIVFYAWLVGQGHFTDATQQAGAFVSMMFTQFIVGAPALHEMFHRENLLFRWLGRLGMVMIFDPWREITHVVTHHLRTVTPYDPDYAWRGQNLYSHLLRTFKGQIVESYELEKHMWTKRERSAWDLRNGWVWRVGILAAFVAFLWIVGGPWGALASVAVCLIGPRLLLEIFNYTQHYGLVTATPGRFDERHTWNHLTPFVRTLALEITNHAGHHEDSYKPFYALRARPTGPQQPPFLICILLAFVPPLWFRMIRPRLRHWDEHYASPQERELAEVENERAGWGDMNPLPDLARQRMAVAS
jgi:hypothetical protein